MASFGRFARYAGTVPDTRLSLRSISDKFEQLVKVADKVPERLFSFKESVSRLSALQSDEGISPVRLLLSRARVRRMAQSPSSGGMDPMKRLLERSKDVVFFQFLALYLLFSSKWIPHKWVGEMIFSYGRSSKTFMLFDCFD